mmetsp:Transcript_47536/g.136247  ORF Transcript_47536/g.136247 Transcript_47536/m.136247 type:complete len:652 (+) Transcript_47536:19-1974(+)
MGAPLSCQCVPRAEGRQDWCKDRPPTPSSPHAVEAECWADVNMGDVPEVMLPFLKCRATSKAKIGWSSTGDSVTECCPPEVAEAEAAAAAAEEEGDPLGPSREISPRTSEEMWTPRVGAGARFGAGDESDGSSSPRPSDCSSSHFRGDKRHVCRRLLVTHTMGHQPSSALQLIIESAEDIRAHYDLEDKILGEGAFGVVRRGFIKATGAVRAVKTINKKRMGTQQVVVKQEIEIMKMLDHPNLLMLFEVMEDATDMYLVLEMCSGGSLQSRIKRAPLKESTAAVVMQQILRAVLYLHKHKIVHRDLKADNCLLDKAGSLDRATIKVADFGLSCNLEFGKMLTRPAGTPTHMAPEVFAKRYTQAADVWSCGVICYGMLCGYMPWLGSSRENLAMKISTTSVDFNSQEWVDVSQNAVDFIIKTLSKTPKTRHTALKALADKWITSNEPKVGRVKLPRKVIEDLRRFRCKNRFKRAALHVIASMLPEEDIKEQRRAFIQLDRDGDGFFTVKELSDALRSMAFAPVSGDFASEKKEQQRCMNSVPSVVSSTAEDGYTYTEFLAATVDMKRALTAGHCQAAFSSFDKNKDGSISISELATGKMLGQLTAEEIVQTMEALDMDGNCELDYDEFVKMMHSETWYSMGSGELPSMSAGH